jgi:alkylhydroperoxidase/carboxymuconolactone decarboxylase family protein YurZ
MSDELTVIVPSALVTLVSKELIAEAFAVILPFAVVRLDSSDVISDEFIVISVSV